MHRKKAFVSVIVPMYNDEKYIAKCLASIFNSGYPAFEVIVVNDGSIDDSLAIAKRFPCRIVDLKKNSGVSNARNQGANVAKGEILVFFDSDVVIERDTISKFVMALESPDVKICECHVHPRSLVKGFAPALIAITWNYDHKVMGKEPSYLSTMAFSIYKGVFDDIGQFNTSLGFAGGGEEFEIGVPIHQHGYSIFLDQSIHVDHHYQHFWPRFETLFRRSYVYGKIVLQRNYKLDKGHGTLKEGINALLSFLGVISLLLGLFFTFGLVAFFAIIGLQVLLDRGLNKFIIKERGFLFFIKSIPVNFLWYFAMGLGVTKAFFVMSFKKITSPFSKFSFLFAKLPPYVILFVTGKCNARCKHCFNWNSKDNDLTLGEIKKISSSFGKIKYLSYSGGEPSIRADIVEITQAFYSQNKVEILNFITNGFATNLLVNEIERILRSCPSISLIVNFSIDGIGKQHDDIRNVPGGFQRLMDSVKKLKELQRYYGNLTLSSITTYSKYNEHNIFEIVDFITKDLKLEMNLNYVRGNTFQKDAKDVSLENYIVAARIIKGRNAGIKTVSTFISAIHDLSSKLIYKTKKENRSMIRCLAGEKMIEIGNDGTIFPCEMLSVNFGNIKDFNYDIARVLNSKKAKDFSGFLKKGKCYCTWECAMKNNLVYSAYYYPALFVELIKNRMRRV